MNNTVPGVLRIRDGEQVNAPKSRFPQSGLSAPICCFWQIRTENQLPLFLELL